MTCTNSTTKIYWRNLREIQRYNCDCNSWKCVQREWLISKEKHILSLSNFQKTLLGSIPSTWFLLWSCGKCEHMKFYDMLLASLLREILKNTNKQIMNNCTEYRPPLECVVPDTTVHYILRSDGSVNDFKPFFTWWSYERVKLSSSKCYSRSILSIFFIYKTIFDGSILH